MDVITKSESHASQSDKESDLCNIPVDKLILEGGLYDHIKSTEGIIKHKVVLRCKLRFHLSKTVKTESIKAQFVGKKTITVTENTGVGLNTETYSEPICGLEWTLWQGTVLYPRKLYEFNFSCELPKKAPRTITTQSGKTAFELTCYLSQCSSSGKLDATFIKHPINNPFSLNCPIPFNDLDFCIAPEEESSQSSQLIQIGSKLDVSEHVSVYIHYPDQYFKGGNSKLPVIVTAKTTNSTPVYKHITSLEIRMVQSILWYFKSEFLVEDIMPVTDLIELEISDHNTCQVELECSIPLNDNRVHGQYQGYHFRARHFLEVTVNFRSSFVKMINPLVAKSKTFREPINIYHRDYSKIFEGLKGVFEAPVGMDPIELRQKFLDYQLSL